MTHAGHPSAAESITKAPRDHRLWWAAGCLLSLYGLVLLAPFLAPYGAEEQDRTLPYAPPMALHFHHPDHGWQLRPMIYPLRPVAGTYDQYEEDRRRPLELSFWIRREDGRRRLLGTSSQGDSSRGDSSPSRVHLLGTDGFGRDIFSRLLFAGRTSLLTGLLAALLSLSLGTLVGALAGYVGGWVDALLMRGCELLTALPWLYLLLAVRAFLPLDVDPEFALAGTLALIACLGWAAPARLIRGAVASLRQRDFVRAAAGFGASHAALLGRHILPHASGLIVIQLWLAVPRYILAEVTLSFLGLGLVEPYGSLGTLLADGLRQQAFLAHPWLLSPAVALILVVLSYHQMASVHEQRARPIAH